MVRRGGVGTGGHVCAGTGSDRRLTFLTQVIPGKLWDLFKLRTDLSLVRPLGLFKDVKGHELAAWMKLRRECDSAWRAFSWPLADPRDTEEPAPAAVGAENLADRR